MHIGKLRTITMQHPQLLKEELGFFEHSIEIDKEDFLRQSDKRGWLIKQIATGLTEQIFVTGIPAQAWKFHATKEVQKELNIPAVLKFAEA